MFCICNLYTREMKLNNKIQISMLCLFIIGISMANGSNKRTGVNKLPADVAKELVQVKAAQAGTVRVEMMLPDLNGEKNIESDMYTIRVTLKSFQPVKQTIMQYMNFGMKNSFWMERGKEPLDCTICERIPGIRQNEFLYMACFNRPAVNADDDTLPLRLYITDTIAGFGITVFNIDSRVFKSYVH